MRSEKDYNNWHTSINKRKALIKRLERLHGIKLDRPHEMKIRELRALLKGDKK